MSAKRFQYVPLCATVILGLLASLGLYLISDASERRLASLDFESRTSDHLSVISTDLQDAFNLLTTLRAYFESSDAPVSRAAFAHFAAILHVRAVGLRDAGWAPHVAAADRDRFEQEMRASGFAGFEIRDRLPDGTLRRAASRPDYYPVLFLDPPDGPAVKVIGLDLMTGPDGGNALRRAVKTGKPAATPPLHLVSMRHSLGILAFAPVNRLSGRGGATLENPDGLVFGAFELGPMLDHIIATKRRLTGLDIYLFDPHAPPGQRKVYWRPNAAGAAADPSEAALRARPHLEGGITIIDQTLGAIFLPDHGVDSVTFLRHVVLPPAAGVVLTAMIASYLLTSLRRTRELEALTHSLRETTAGLQRKTETITHMARHDALTGLPNRRYFAEVLRHCTERSATCDKGCAILQIDLDRFKPVNDMYGHSAGDEVLCEVARRLQAITRTGTTVARLGGDEFALIVEDAHVEDAGEAVAARVIEALGKPIVTSQATVEIGASIGIAHCPADGTDPEGLLHAADLAMYSAKRQDPGTLRRFDPRMDLDIRHRVSLESDKRRAACAPPQSQADQGTEQPA